MSEYHAYECAFCGEENSLLIDSPGGRRYALTEDCQVCCRPNLIAISFDTDGVLTLDVTPEYGA
jgi:Cysteine-rich CPXCG